MEWERRRFDDRRGGESYRPSDRAGRSPSRGYDRHRRSPPRNRSRPRADTWVPSNRNYGRPRSRSPPDFRRRSRTPPFQSRGYGPPPYGRRRSPPRRPSPRRDDRIRSPPPSWRSRSPFSEGKSRDASRGRGSPKRAREATPGSQDFRGVRRQTPAVTNQDLPPRIRSPRPQLASALPSRSPSHAPLRRDPPADLSRDKSLLRSRPSSPMHAPMADSNTTSRRSSPGNHAERGGLSFLRSRSRSSSRQSPSHRVSKTTVPGRSSPRDRDRDRDRDRGRARPADSEPEMTAAGKGPRDLDRPSDTPEQPRLSSIPTQPRHINIGGQSPPSGPSQGPKMAPAPNRGSHNLALLSAPTRPRRGGSREGSWSSSPMARRGPPGNVPPSVPSGPRASFTPPMPGGGYRHTGPRPNSSISVASPSSPIPKAPNHLAGLNVIIPGGKLLPSSVDPATEKRLSQLEADREKLLEHVAETQNSKRTGLRDWDRLDREISICALKSELAEGHLQRMADESIGGGIPF